MIVELTGGVGSGKSRILEFLKEEYGAEILQTDETARQLQQKGEEGFRKMVEILGDGILGPDGQLDREKTARRLFQDPAALEAVNSSIHPMVWDRIHGQARASKAPLVVVESAVPDQNPNDIYDEVWYVYTRKEVRIQRLMESRGYGREKSLQVMERQLPEEAYRVGADRVIDNSGDFEETKQQIRQITEGKAG